jgi:Flp pilus assembly protein TadD
MNSPQDQYDDAMYDFSMGEYDRAISKLGALLAEDDKHFEARLALGMAYYRKGDFAAAIAEGHKAEALRPHEQLVHTNLSLFYMKAGDKKTAEHHGLQARIASWRTDAAAAKTGDSAQPHNPELDMVKPTPSPAKFPEMPWKKKK